MKRTLAIAALVITSATASAIVTRATYMKKSAFRDAPAICLKPVDPGAGNAVSAFDVSVVICPQEDPAQLEGASGLPCQTVLVPAYAATAGQKNWIKAAWSQAVATAVLPETAADAP